MTTSLDISRQVNLNSLALETQDVDLTGNLTVAGTSAFTGNQTVTGNSVVGGNETITGNLTVTGTTTLSSGAVPRSISGMGATKTLALTDTGSTIVFDRGAGTVVTLPATTNVGTTFTFVVGTQNTSATNKIITSAGTIFLIGGVYVDKSLTITRYDGNGTNHVSLNWSGGTDSGTTGGLNGSYVTLRCINATQWLVEGTQVAGGTLATPFATS